ncbi:unannotated protein [freshwater metagenome]|uniref:Unannotated protein n=1 Tax=freshwater metagenome TaxID=449393 RepID=A0A6J7EUA6_9ZZZZ
MAKSVLLALLLLAGLSAPVAFAQPMVQSGGVTSGPVVTSDKTEINPGEFVVLTIEGFTASFVTISVCGNEARRGSADCNMVASEGMRLSLDHTPTRSQIPVAAPPVGCPCVIRVSNRTNDEIAVVPITLIGHPDAPVVNGPTINNALAVSISARAASGGLLSGLRPSLGGPTTYEVTVTVKNRSTVALNQVRLSGSAGRSSTDSLAVLALDNPGEIAPGQTWQQIVSAVVPAPSFGSVEWRVAASGAGPTISATDITHHRPLLLLLLTMLLVVIVFMLAMRYRIRRRAGRGAVA